MNQEDRSTRTILFFRIPPPFYDNSLSFRAFRAVLKIAYDKRAKALNLDAIHDTVHEMARDEARHGKAFKGLLERYFGK